MKQEPKKVLTEEDIFNQKDIDAVTDYINRETSKQETLEEAAERYTEEHKWEEQDPWFDFIEGAKWQQERSYSEEEVMDILLLSYSSISDKSLAGADLRKWFEQFKKK